MTSAPPTAASDPDDAVKAAVANAALDGAVVEADEQDLIRRRHRGEITHDQFLTAARAMAVAKTPRQ